LIRGSSWRDFVGHLKSFLLLAAFILISLLFFRLSADNGFWHGYDFVTLENSAMMNSDLSAAFNSAPPFKFQPLVNLIHYILFKRFLFDATGYYFFNILMHGLNSFLVYLIVNVLLRDRYVAILSGILFVFTVGNYGKAVMIASGMEDLIITCLTLCTMIFYFKNELYHEGKVLSGWYLLALLFFVATMLTRNTSFSILGCFVAFNFFFRSERGRKVFHRGFIVLLVLAIAALVVKTLVFQYTPPLYSSDPGPVRFVYYAVRNMIHYLIRMIFPIHTSSLVAGAGPAVRFVYRFATEIRILIMLTVLSYSFFGFVFGNRTIRFFIAWTYIMIFPFAFFQFPYDWLNIRHLYLVSVGFVSVISAGAVYCSRLIASHRWRRFVPLVVPVAFILLARFIVVQLDNSYEAKAAGPLTERLKESLAERNPNISIEDGRLYLDQD
jgi:hypothetical protein